MSDNRTPIRSSEVEGVFRRMLRAWEDRDPAALGNLYSAAPWFRAIGSDAEEWWGTQAFNRVATVQLREMPHFDITWHELEAYELGTVAWGAANTTCAFDNGATFDFRVSAVFLIEDGVWRCVQSHASIPQPNEEAIGVALTATLDGLLDSLDAETLAPVESNEGTATLMFTDIENSTAIAAELGDRRWRETIEAHDLLIADTAARHGGSVVKSLGDGALLAFGGSRTALRCAVELQEGFAGRPFAVRIGVHAGDVVHSGADVIGTTVNKAARVTAAASGGQIVVSSIVRELVGATDEFSFGDPFLVELKGMPGTHELMTVGSSESVPASAG